MGRTHQDLSTCEVWKRYCQWWAKPNCWRRRTDRQTDGRTDGQHHFIDRILLRNPAKKYDRPYSFKVQFWSSVDSWKQDTRPYNASDESATAKQISQLSKDGKGTDILHANTSQNDIPLPKKKLFIESEAQTAEGRSWANVLIEKSVNLTTEFTLICTHYVPKNFLSKMAATVSWRMMNDGKS